MRIRRVRSYRFLAASIALVLAAGCGQEKPDQGEPVAAAEQPATPGVKEQAGEPAPEPEQKPEPVAVSPELEAKCKVFEAPWRDEWWVTWGRENPEAGEEWMDTIEEKMAKADLSVIPQCKHIEHLFIGFSEIEDLKPITTMKQVKYLDLRFSTKLKDLTPLAELENLEHLVISGTGVTDLAPLTKVRSLKELEARQLMVRDISALAELPELWRVDLLKDPVSDMTPLARAPKVRKVKLCQTDIEGYDDLLPVAERITELETCNSKIKLEKFEQLAAFKNLTFLRLWGNPIEDLTPLAGMTKLEELDLTQTKVKDLTPLHNLKSLKLIYLIMVEVDDAQVEALQKALPDAKIERKMQFN
jgi:Leucine-rich repeat (LRR) protein